MNTALVLLIVLAQSTAGAQRSAAPASDAAIVARGWTALADGRTDVAVADADRVLARRAWDHDAIALKIHALTAASPIKALDAYDKWMGRGAEDTGLLEPIARGVAMGFATGPQGPLRREARRMLTAARVSLPAATDTDEEPFAPDASAARQGNAEALQRLEAAAADPNVPNKAPLVAALEQVGPPAEHALTTILQQNANGPAAGDAARALGKIGATQAIPALQAAMNAMEPYTQFSASVALAELGDPAGQQAVTAMLASQIPDVRLMAAEAMSAHDGPWVAAIMPLLANTDGLIRFRAARLIAPYNPDAAARTFEAASTDPNPVVRSEALKDAADVAEQQPSVLEISTLRTQLRDGDPAVRLYAAKGILILARLRR